MNKNSRYWAIGAIVVLALVLVWIMFSAGTAGDPPGGMAATDASQESSGAMGATTAANDSMEGTDGAHDGHSASEHSGMGSSNLNNYMEEQDDLMADMMTGMKDIPESGIPAVDFLAGMIPHHRAAIDMAKSYLRYGGENSELKKLAQDIEKVQQEEIDQMNKMIIQLKDSEGENADQAKAYRDEYNKMFEDGSHDHHMPGTTPASVDEAFAEGMLMHHQMAVDMSRSILEYTDQEEVKELAQNIITQQEKEIAQMEKILKEIKQNDTASPTS